MVTVTRWCADKVGGNLPRLALLTLLLFIFAIDYRAQGDFTLCLFKNITGRDCPGCGVLRGISAVLHLDFARAYALNRMNIVIIPLLGFFLRASGG